jgi:hypothetical protein
MPNQTPEKIRAFILTFYVASASRDIEQLINKYLREQLTGDYNSRWQQLNANAA